MGADNQGAPPGASSNGSAAARNAALGGNVHDSPAGSGCLPGVRGVRRRARRHRGGRAAVDNWTVRLARHPGAQRDRSSAAIDRRRENTICRARRRVRHDLRGEERAKADQRGACRRHPRPLEHPQFARRARFDRPRRRADDLAGGIERHHRAPGRQPALGVQAGADGGDHAPAGRRRHRAQGRQDRRHHQGGELVRRCHGGRHGEGRRGARTEAGPT